jgi:biopolymer transport protein ExbD
MTPMIDVVFLLVIFFLVSSHLAKRESKVPMRLPTASRQDSNQSIAGRLVANVESHGLVSIGGAEVDADRLALVMREHFNNHGADSTVHLRSDASVDYAVIEPLLRAATRAGISNITFAVEESN